jgi:DNA ligase D-like protein (predicted 3'-phosphoesterase)
MSEKREPLKEYRRKRDFARTPEPAEAGRESEGLPLFVVQKHAARRLHYDFRLEAGGALKSWAVPKGPSLNPRDKRLAVPVEDHPLSYADFEGSIPEGEYGAGAVIVWDTGRYRNITEHHGEPVETEQALAAGHLVFELLGTKLRGRWALTRVATGKEERWILVKGRDEYADEQTDVAADQPRSVLSGRTVEEAPKEEG